MKRAAKVQVLDQIARQRLQRLEVRARLLEEAPLHVLDALVLVTPARATNLGAAATEFTNVLMDRINMGFPPSISSI